MLAFVQTPIISFILLAVLSLEAIALYVYWIKQQRGLPPLQILSFLGAGAAFASALGLILLNAGPLWIAASLFLAFVFHILDLVLRWE